jgi:nudix-type nucleoside diphosphatase (YffH/AdpP family)
LLHVVAGEVLETVPARAAGLRVMAADGGRYPMIRDGGETVEGLFLPDVPAEALERLDYYENGYGFTLRELAIETDAGPGTALCYFPDDGPADDGVPWRLEDWVAEWGAICTWAAVEFMECMGRMDAGQAAALYPQMLVRAASRLRAESDAGPVALRADLTAADVLDEAPRQPYTAFFSLSEQRLRFPRFDGSLSAPVERVAFVSGDAVTVLPYDPVRDRVLVVEQFRYGIYRRGDPRPWSLEAVAGRIDPGESPEAAARREAMEEAGLVIGALHHVSSYYPSPGAVTEYLLSYVGVADLPDEAAGLGGVPDEHEDIRGHVIARDRLMDLIETGEVDNAPLILTAWWLEANRARLA